VGGKSNRLTDESGAARQSINVQMSTPARNPVVHLELHSRDLPQASAFYAELLGWRRERIETADGSYLALELGAGVSGGLVQCPAERSLWLPYVEVADVDATTAHAQRLGGSVLLAPREGPAGWRSVIASRAGAQIALWQQKR
jgi:predicted enzyme related to lactoylglutathione lyase